MSETLKKKIYISPISGDYVGVLLVLDHVESMSHLSNSVITSHPVESQNQNISDHRYQNGKVISITGMISDEWDTPVVVDPTPIFQSIYFKSSKRLRAAVAINDPDSWTQIYVNNILDGFQAPSDEDIEHNVPEEKRFYLTQAQRIKTSEDDMLEEAKSKNISVEKENSNISKINGIVSSINSAKEVLQSLDSNSNIVTIQSVWDQYPNMVLKSFNNVLRNGPQRGAYWVNLVFEEEMIAQEATNNSSTSPENSEELADNENKGKVDPTIAGPTDENVVAVQTIYAQVLAEQVSDMATWIAVNPNNKSKIISDAEATYMNASASNGDSAELATSTNINANMQIVASYRGNTPW